eukprot:TRINITY_DN4029_c0_g1_i7.p1 TRINITY_DN4029_c0_g1~~TRINITY_DN4029_c0_g1_i7.p1  ORF type:complete len:414 (-),score=66.60 TRINITY_DN4029_c0_g1_i7:39-1220(-)
MCIRDRYMGLLFAPLMDTYFSRRIGKRKTYILPTQYIFAALQYGLSFYIDDIVLRHQVGLATAVGFISVLIVAIQDVAVDGWALTLLHPANLSLGATCQSLGQILGGVIAFNVFIDLNSTEFCMKWFGTAAILSAGAFLRILAVVTLIVTLLIHFLQPETQVGPSEFSGLRSTLRSFKGFFLNKHTRWFLLFVLTLRVGFMPVEASSTLLLIERGFHKEHISSMTIYLTLANLLSSYIAGVALRGKSYIKALFRLYLGKFPVHLIAFLILINVNIDHFSLWYYLVLFAMVLVQCIQAPSFLTVSSIVGSVCEEEVGGLYMTTLYSAINLGVKIAESVTLVLLGFLPFNLVFVLGLIYSAVFYLIWRRRVSSWADLPKDEWRITTHIRANGKKE